MLPLEIERFSDERTLALQKVAQEASRSSAASSHVYLAPSHNHAAQHIRAVAEHQFQGRLPDHMVTHFVNVFNMTEDAIRQIVDAEPLHSGIRVVLEGLEARPELNGRTGLLVRFFPEKGRWAVRLEGSSEEPILLRPDKFQKHHEQPQRQEGESVEYQ